MAEFDKDVYCDNCGMCRAKSTDYLGRCSDCGKREWVLQSDWPTLEELSETTGQDIEQLNKDRETFSKYE